LLWRNDSLNHAYGVFSVVEENRKLAFSWHDGSDRPATHIDVTMKQDGGTTHLTLTHSGFTNDEQAKKYDEEWSKRLDNLQSILETGAHRTIIDRVIMGFYPGTFDEEVAKTLGVPVAKGARVGGLVAGYSAEAAGLQADDVITQIDDTSITNEDDNTVFSVTRNKKAGDTVTITYYRGAKKRTASVALKGYPVPPIPKTFTQMADEWAADYAVTIKTLTQLVREFPAEAVDHKANDSEYSLRESLAHFILQQRHTLEWLSTYHVGPRRINPFQNDAPRIKAALETFPTPQGLLNKLEETQAETVNIIRLFPKAMEAKKGYLWWMTFEVGFLPAYMEQHYKRLNDLKQSLVAQTA
jgi:hypothetical protein